MVSEEKTRWRGGGKGHGVGREGRGTFVAYARLRDIPLEAVEASMMMMVMPYLLDLISTKREVQRVGWMGRRLWRRVTIYEGEFLNR